MIQRIQSIYLLLTIIFSVLFLQRELINFFNANGGEIVVNASGITSLANTSAVEEIRSILLTILLYLIPVISLITIFLYKKRKLQLRFTVSLILLIVILILTLVYYTYSVTSKFNAEISFRLKLVYPFVMLMCSFLAYRGIRKDEDIVKSYDRLR